MSFFARLFGGSRKDAPLTPEERYEWEEKLGHCDYRFAVRLLEEEFEKKRPRGKLALLFEAYRKGPCLDTAVAMIRHDEGLFRLFATSTRAKKLRESMRDEFEGE